MSAVTADAATETIRGTLKTRHLTVIADVELSTAPIADAVLAERAGAYRLSAIAPQGRSTALQFELWTDFSEVPLKVFAPLDRVGLGSHQLVLRLAHTNLDLYVDGVLMDEEFPIGSVELRAEDLIADPDAVASLREVDHALDPIEIAALAGGTGAVAARHSSYVGTWQAPAWGLQYWRPSGHNEYVADCQPVFADGRFHVYFQRGRRSHGNKWGLGAHEKGHVSSADLRWWDMHPIALRITEEWEGSLATGCVFHHDGTYYMYYATRMPDRVQVVDMATSKDGLAFTKHPPQPLAAPQAPYKSGPFRDPHVFEGPDGRFHMLVTGALAEPEVHNHGGTLAHLTSDDLFHWQQQEPFLTPGYRDHEPECPDHFEWNGRYYLIFSHHGVAHYRISDSAFGPWHCPPVDTLDGVFVRVMQTAQFHGGRRIGAAFLTPPGTFGGALIFREIAQREDGTLATSFPPELTPRGRPVKTTVEPLTAGVREDASGTHLDGTQSIAAIALRGAGGNVRLTATIEPGADCLAVGVVLGGSENMKGGHELRFDLPRQTASWRVGRMKSWESPDLSTIRQLEGLDRPFSIEVVRVGDVLDLCINGERTLATIQAREPGNDLFFYVHDGKALLRDLVVEVLPEPSDGN